jgi:uncharacterized protein (DUF1810 family)
MTVDDLARFVKAQEDLYPRALAELRNGWKRSHWMWFVFPQIAGLGHSETAQYYAIRDLDQARRYLAHPVLGPRLVEAGEAVLGWAGQRSAGAVMGETDALKLRSSATLFEAAGGGAVFARLIEGFYDGVRDPATLALL